MRPILAALAFAVALLAQAPDANEIMRRVSVNIDRAEAARAHFVYDQDVFVRLQRADGRPAREESRQYAVAPRDQGASRTLVKLQGKIFEVRKEIDYGQAGFRRKDVDIDGALVDSFAREVAWRRSAIPNTGWFPFESKDLQKYKFTLEGEENYRGYDVFRISFREADDGGEAWEGEALIERSEFQPILITTAWIGHIPLALRIGLGINLQHIGAKITFQRFAKNVWFPVSCGGELKLRVLFLYARTLAFRSTSSDFRKADVESSIRFEENKNP